jgi:hypothetical protein
VDALAKPRGMARKVLGGFESVEEINRETD